MFIRVSKVKYGGKIYHYLRIVENIRRKDKVIQHVIANLGDLNLIDKDNLYNLCLSLSRYAGRKLPSHEELQSISTLHYKGKIRVKGHVMVCVLAYLIEKILEKSLKETTLKLSVRKEHRQILKSAGITDLPRILQS